LSEIKDLLTAYRDVVAP